MNTAVLSVGTTAITTKSFGTAYTASDTDDGSSALGEPDSLTASVPGSFGTISAYAAAENIIVCKTSKTASNKDSTGLTTLRFCFNIKISSIP
ncbi:hypothetical protein D3C78_477740 [compost metagenome]